jgi:hypothetical protein
MQYASSIGIHFYRNFVVIQDATIQHDMLESYSHQLKAILRPSAQNSFHYCRMSNLDDVVALEIGGVFSMSKVDIMQRFCHLRIRES